VSHPTKLKPRPLRNPGQNNGVRLRREPPTIAGAAATGSRRTPISRAVGCSLISRGSDAAAPVAVILDAISSINWIADIWMNSLRSQFFWARDLGPQARVGFPCIRRVKRRSIRRLLRLVELTSARPINP